MKLFDVLLVGIGSSILIKAIKDNKKEKEAEKKRKSTECFFDEIVTSDIFAYMVALISKDIDRLTAYNKGPIVYGRVESQTGKTSWTFSLDFNDYGRITGRYWKYTENKDSNIPDGIGSIMSTLITNLHNSKSVDTSYSEQCHNDTVSITGDSEYELNTEIKRQHKQVNKEKTIQKRNAFRKKHWKAYVASILILCVAIFGAYKYWQFSKLRVIGVSSNSAMEKNYEDIENRLMKSGFTDIVTVPESDLDGQDLQQENLIAEITINNQSDFDEDDKFPYDAEIVIHYHSAKIVGIPFSSKEIKGKNYKKIKAQFEELGFVNIKLEKDEDLIVGWIHKDGEIESVSIDGNKDFDENYNTRIDSKIIITYHTYKSKK